MRKLVFPTFASPTKITTNKFIEHIMFNDNLLKSLNFYINHQWH